MSPLSEVRSVTLGVADLERALALYGDLLGFEPLARGPVPQSLSAAWRLPASGGAEMAQLAQGGERRGMIRLLACNPPGEPIWRLEDRLTGDGFFAVNLRVRDLGVLLPRLAAAGVEVPEKPFYWEVSQEVAVWDSMSQDPDGVHLDLFAYVRGGHLRGPLERQVSVVQTVAIATPDVDRCRRFYDRLGFEVLFDLRLEGLESLLRLPPGTVIHNVNMRKDGHIVPGRVECFRYHGTEVPPPVSLGERSLPPNLGILAITFETAAFDAGCELLLEAGARPIAEAVEASLPGYGESRLATFLGPDGECLELIAPRAGAGWAP